MAHVLQQSAFRDGGSDIRYIDQETDRKKFEKESPDAEAPYGTSGAVLGLGSESRDDSVLQVLKRRYDGVRAPAFTSRQPKLFPSSSGVGEAEDRALRALLWSPHRIGSALSEAGAATRSPTSQEEGDTKPGAQERCSC